jgi:hypothetical protein
MWPQLPSWFWPVCGYWEILAGLLVFYEADKNLTTAENKNPMVFAARLALPMTSIFLGGVYYSLLSIPPSFVRQQPWRIRLGTLVPVTTTLILALLSAPTPTAVDTLFQALPWLVLGFETGHRLSTTTANTTSKMRSFKID